MAYSRSWDITSPAGSGQVSGGDDAIRAMKEDIEERLESIFEDIDDDPLEFKPSVIGSIGAKTGKTLIIPAEAFTPTEDDDDVTWFDQYVQSDNSGDREMKAPVILPPGVTITKIEFLWNKQTLAGLRGELLSVDFDTGVALNTVAGPFDETGAGVVLTDSGAMSYVIDPDLIYKIRIKPTSLVTADRVVIYGVRITYDASDATETL